jgi:hypothetical protein
LADRQYSIYKTDSWKYTHCPRSLDIPCDIQNMLTDCLPSDGLASSGGIYADWKDFEEVSGCTGMPPR